MHEVSKVTKNTMQLWVGEVELEAANGDTKAFVESLPIWNKVRERLGLRPTTERDLLVMRVEHLKHKVSEGNYDPRPESRAKLIGTRRELLEAESVLLGFDEAEAEAAKPEPVKVGRPAERVERAVKDSPQA